MINLLALMGAVTTGLAISLNPFQTTATQTTAATVQTQPAAVQAGAQTGAAVTGTTPATTPKPSVTPAPSTSPAATTTPATTQPAPLPATQAEQEVTIQIETNLPDVSVGPELEATILNSLHLGL